MSAEFKAKGNAAFQGGKIEEAINWFTQAIEVDPSNHVLYSNRSAAYCSKGEAFDLALADAKKTVELEPNWPKGWGRVGAAHHGKKDFKSAIDAYKKGLEIEPDNDTCLKGVVDCGGGPRPSSGRSSMQAMGGGAGGENPFAKIFGPDVFAKIAMNPKLAPYLEEPDYVNMIKAMQTNPQSMNQFLQDQRVMQTFAALAGINMDMMGGKGGDEEMPQAPKPKPQSTSSSVSPEEKEKKDREDRATAEKEKGNAFYKKKEFEQALECYDSAIEIYPENILFHVNKAAVFIEQGRFDDCLAVCDVALAKGQELRTDSKIIAKVYARKASALYKMKDFDQCIAMYKSALLNHRTSDVLQKLNSVEKEKKDAEAAAYQSPELAQEAKEKGNECFKTQQFPEAIKAYTEAIKRNPKDPTFYCNRAAAYTKLRELAHAMTDCDIALDLDPTYVKAIIRKAHIYYWRKEFHKALATYEQGLKLAPDNEELKGGVDSTHRAIAESQQSGEVDEDRVRMAMADPEIQMILQDPVMQGVLRDFSDNPTHAQAHMKDPSVMAKLQKLIAAGVVSTKSR